MCRLMLNLRTGATTQVEQFEHMSAIQVRNLNLQTGPTIPSLQFKQFESTLIGNLGQDLDVQNLDNIENSGRSNSDWNAVEIEGASDPIHSSHGIESPWSAQNYELNTLRAKSSIRFASDDSYLVMEH